MRTARLVLVALLSASTFACCTDPVNGRPYFCLRDVPRGQEIAIGNRHVSNFTAQSGGAYPDSELKSHLQGIVIDKLAANSHRPTLPWEFQILNTSQVNAFALPGGPVFVTRGLLALVESEAQFAHLMGHEIGHIAHKHSLRGQGRKALLSIIVGVVGVAENNLHILLRDPDNPLIVTGLTGFLGQVPFLKFSRDQELQSDERGVDYALANGYDPREGKKTFAAFQKLKGETGVTTKILTSVLSTHPLDETRIRALDRYLESVSFDPEELVVTTPEWERLAARLRAAHSIYEKYDEALALLGQSAAAPASSANDPSTDEDITESLDQAESVFKECTTALPDHAPFHVGLGLVAFQRKRLERALEHLDGAVGCDDRHFESRLFRGLVFLRLERHDAAVTDFIAAFEIYPSNPLPYYHLGQVTEAMDRPDGAKTWYRKALQRSPRGTELRRMARARLEAIDEAEAAED